MLPLIKTDKGSFAYVDPKTTNPICGKCVYFVKGGKCLLVKGEISGKNGSCNYWVKGPSRIYPIGTPPFTQKESGYVETPNGPRCGTCTFYSDPRRCELVKGDIEPKTGCCNAWKKPESK